MLVLGYLDRGEARQWWLLYVFQLTMNSLGGFIGSGVGVGVGVDAEGWVELALTVNGARVVNASAASRMSWARRRLYACLWFVCLLITFSLSLINNALG
ncbi:MAG: hypothetical protein DYG89_38950 [Caldilinea sp. CFX5]|nr:hypothetical protein [Caldilinea sp. CFX5]